MGIIAFAEIAGVISGAVGLISEGLLEKEDEEASVCKEEKEGSMSGIGIVESEVQWGNTKSSKKLKVEMK